MHQNTPIARWMNAFLRQTAYLINERINKQASYS